MVVETTGRLLALLAALQSERRTWSGPELAARFEVTVRTIRRDVERLRQLGYPIETEVGMVGGYHLGRGGTATPPLMLERDEAVAIAAALRAVPPAAPATAALAKLEQFLPPTVRREMSAVGDMTLGLGGHVAAADPAVLVALTTACRDSERVRIGYVTRDGVASERTVTPLRVVHAAGRWYVVAHDRERGEWRTFRLDRIRSVVATGHREPPPDPPDPHRFVQAALSISPYRYQVRVLFAAPLEALATKIPAETAVLAAAGDASTLVTTGGDSLDYILWHLLDVGVDFTVLDPPELIDRMGELRDRLVHLLGANRPATRHDSSP